jgi:hypothetical protein
VSEGPEEASGRFTDYRLPADYEKRDRPAGVDSSKSRASIHTKTAMLI